MVNADKKLYSGEKFFEIYDSDIDDNNINKKYHKELYVNTFFQNQSYEACKTCRIYMLRIIVRKYVCSRTR